LLNLKLLGTAAGGGFPQWNCACSLCHLSRSNPVIVPPRLHLQAVLSGVGPERFLINASPDLKFQMESYPPLHPTPECGPRNSPVSGILLTGADLDQVLGLLLLREFQPLRVYATALTRRILEANSFFRMLQRVPAQLTWAEIVPGKPFQIGESIVCTPIPMHGGLPYYANSLRRGGQALEDAPANIGLLIESGGRRIAYTPSLPQITGELQAIYNACDLILVDGTFWSDTELSQTHEGTPLARAIGHIPMSGLDGTMDLLRSVSRPQKVFIHINNTNPVLDPRSPERRIVEESGWRIADDGSEWSWNG
jgi:pyrroloquinoline quinone biosynthesis protein B